jgi:hypothetical protein
VCSRVSLAPGLHRVSPQLFPETRIFEVWPSRPIKMWLLESDGALLKGENEAHSQWRIPETADSRRKEALAYPRGQSHHRPSAKRRPRAK